MKSSEALNLETVITHARGVFRAELDGTLLVAAQYGGQGHCMDPVGVFIWENHAESRSIKSLCELLYDRYDVERTECEREVLMFIAELLEKNLVMIAEPAP
jgi:hypothetical protein